MSDKSQVRKQLRSAGLRATAPRVAVLSALQDSSRPLSHTEVVAVIGTEDWDRATIFRNLSKLEAEGFARVASSVGGVTRYEATKPGEDARLHPHFACRDCGQVTCLHDAALQIPTKGGWREALFDADLQLVGRCPECRGLNP